MRVKTFLIPLFAVLIFVFYKTSVASYKLLSSIFTTIESPEQVTSLRDDSGYVINPGVVSIQSFLSGRLLSSGSGVILTDDGLLVTLNSLVPSRADFYQVAIEGKLNRGRVVSRNSKANLAFLALDDGGFAAAAFRTERPQDNEETLVASLRSNFGKLILEIKSAKDSVTETGSVLMDKRGQVLGLVDISREGTKIIESEIIAENFISYISKQK